MKRGNKLRILIVVCILAVSFPIAALDAGESSNAEIIPEWHVGDMWRVAVSFTADGERGSRPVAWTYRVRQVPGSGEGYVLAVSCDETEPGITVRLVYRQDFSLARVTMFRTVGGTARKVSTFYEAGAPVMTRRSPVPFDTPVFPLTVTVPPASYKTVRHMSDGLKYRVTFTQEVTKDKSDAEGLVVTCSASDGMTFTQRWLPGRPWPVYGENDRMTYRLVDE